MDGPFDTVVGSSDWMGLGGNLGIKPPWEVGSLCLELTWKVLQLDRTCSPALGSLKLAKGTPLGLQKAHFEEVGFVLVHFHVSSRECKLFGQDIVVPVTLPC